ncbi:hypothetical protein SAMN04488548_1343778 [Gordonia westfalica]|uniref:Uncharacterized protein n=1 Tax=Gordonia westfalica TaxID=158898 RepID=A0A1H2KVQ6_9ACTN|nr:hypothetical protein SAMN04488548_1343778 [Gordonia westfalica]
MPGNLFPYRIGRNGTGTARRASKYSIDADDDRRDATHETPTPDLRNGRLTP